MQFFFGPAGSYLERCIQRAYRDLNRTLHGIARHPNRSAVRAAATKFLLDELERLRGSNLATVGEFDLWHEATCQALIAIYAEGMYSTFTVGHAQKWVNMILKYVFIFGEERVPGYSSLYPLAHIPLDNIILKRLSAYGAPKPSVAWSRLRSYAEYRAFQNWVRHAFRGSVPIAVEFWLYSQAGAAPTEP